MNNEDIIVYHIVVHNPPLSTFEKFFYSTFSVLLLVVTYLYIITYYYIPSLVQNLQSQYAKQRSNLVADEKGLIVPKKLPVEKEDACKVILAYFWQRPLYHTLTFFIPLRKRVLLAVTGSLIPLERGKNMTSFWETKANELEKEFQKKQKEKITPLELDLSE